ncbi:MAG: hypothetical protein HZA79_01860 [Sphingobacteriales bacterium]|nr:hypothetical protein [Sphingobacteriales bacterium]
MTNPIYIEEFLKQEKDRLSPLVKWFGIEPELETTLSICGEGRKKKNHNEVLIRPSWLYRLMVIPFILLNLLMIGVLTNLAVQHNLPFFVNGGLLVFLLALFFVTVYYSFLDKRKNYTILISNEGIFIRGERFPWNEIRETFILTIPKTKGHPSYLVILTSKNEFKKFDLYHFSVSDKKLAEYVEGYKKVLGSEGAVSREF